ncbi:MAG TPA: hypothetical protein VJJ98_04525 [Sedimentisphaerales bacterium]|nr:hypothetical protein [Sedimentisphaerales bacterium]
MKKNKPNRLDPARQSLNEILQRIEPYIPKTPKINKEKPRGWKIVGNGTLPPLNSLGYE